MSNHMASAGICTNNSKDSTQIPQTNWHEIVTKNSTTGSPLH